MGLRNLALCWSVMFLPSRYLDREQQLWIQIHLDPDPGFWPHLDLSPVTDPDPGLCYQFELKKKIVLKEQNEFFFN